MAKREEATPESNPRDQTEPDEAPSVKEASEVDEKLEGDQQVMQPDSS